MPLRSGSGSRFGPSLLGAGVLALFLLPVATLLVLGLFGEPPDWLHLARFVLPRAAATTLLLLLGVGIVTAIVGTATAWLVAAHDFPGRGALAVLLVLPLTVPTYIAAYAWVEVLDYGGPVQAFARAQGLALPVPDLRSLPGAVFVLSGVLYPYVFLTARVAFAFSGASTLEVARTLGAPAGAAFRTVALPLARPAIVAGTTLALLETLNDIGAVETLGVRTFTFAVYETWLNRGSLAGAGVLALALLATVLMLILTERRSRRDVPAATRTRPLGRTRLRGAKALAAAIACFLPPVLGFLAPLALMSGYAWRRRETWWEPALLEAVAGSVRLGLLVTLAAVALVLAVQAARRFSRSSALRLADGAVTLGYALPGTVLAIGVLVPLAALDNALDAALRPFGLSTGLLLTGSLAALVYAATLRFAAIGHGAVAAGFRALSPNVDLAARTLGARPWRIVGGVHLPLLAPALAAAALLVLVDAAKELPATLLMRPFGFETLATLIYTRGSQGDFEAAAFAALLVVALGLVPLVAASALLNRGRIAVRPARGGPGTGPTLPGSLAPRGS